MKQFTVLSLAAIAAITIFSQKMDAQTAAQPHKGTVSSGQATPSPATGTATTPQAGATATYHKGIKSTPAALKATKAKKAKKVKKARKAKKGTSATAK